MALPNDHIMVDIETLSNDIRHGTIMAIGAIAFNMIEPIPYPDEKNFSGVYANGEFYLPINLESQAAFGLQIDAETLRWWLSEGRSKTLLELFLSPRQESIQFVFQWFQWWCQTSCESTTPWLWSHGVSYDCMHLSEKWPIIMKKPFSDVIPFRHMRDTRTLFALYNEKFEKSPYPEVARHHHHHPLEDAWIQACAVQTAWTRLKHDNGTQSR